MPRHMGLCECIVTSLTKAMNTVAVAILVCCAAAEPPHFGLKRGGRSEGRTLTHPRQPTRLKQGATGRDIPVAAVPAYIPMATCHWQLELKPAWKFHTAVHAILYRYLWRRQLLLKLLFSDVAQPRTSSRFVS